jgi:AcrR family transcriptional regulator
VPKRVDHEERRQQIAGALVRIAGTRGLQAAGMREVAAEAGVSLRLVQHYFGTKEQLLLFTAQYLGKQLGERVRARVRAAGTPPAPRAVIQAILTEALPSDEESRIFHIVWASYAVLALTDPAFAMQPLIRNSDVVEDVIFHQLQAAQQAGQMPLHLDARTEATSLMAISAGLGTSVMAGQRSPEDGLGIIRYHLDRLLPAPQPRGACPGEQLSLDLLAAAEPLRAARGGVTWSEPGMAALPS